LPRLWPQTGRTRESSYKGKEVPGTIVSIDDGIGVRTSDGKIILTVIQPEGKKKMTSQDFLNGYVNKKELLGKILR